ncbi:MAG: PilZ domain-containing protein [Nitrospira sp.]|nr:PilZ domain-containing protein [Nitrospira sp.]
MDLSREKRWKVQYPVQLFTEDLFVEGRTVDMSLHGLRVATESSIRQGAHVVVQVLVPEGGCPIDGVLYTVRWIDKGKIGLEVSEMSGTEQQRLQARLTSLGQGQEPVVKSTSPCMTIEPPITSFTGTVAVLWQLFFPGHHVAGVSNRSLHSLQKSK